MADTELRNIRVSDDLWVPAGEACMRHGTDRSAVARRAWEREIALDKDPLLKRAVRLARRWDTDLADIERAALEAYLDEHLPVQRRATA